MGGVSLIPQAEQLKKSPNRTRVFFHGEKVAEPPESHSEGSPFSCTWAAQPQLELGGCLSGLLRNLYVTFSETIYQGMKHAVVMFQTVVGHSFKCVSEQSLQLSAHLQLKTTNVQLQAFDFEDDHFGNGKLKMDWVANIHFRVPRVDPNGFLSADVQGASMS